MRGPGASKCRLQHEAWHANVQPCPPGPHPLAAIQLSKSHTQWALAPGVWQSLPQVSVNNHARSPSQAAKTYLEKHFESFPAASVDDLIKHGLKAVQASLQDAELTSANAAIAIVGK